MEVFDQGGETSGSDQIEIEESLEIETQESLEIEIENGFKQRLQCQSEEWGQQTEKRRE